ncbi:MAG: hypothetical protein HOV81_39720 [Kofleriaceae bacterium]|nr:hypothetical protein [Kofleriaceae bacterium]
MDERRLALRADLLRTRERGRTLWQRGVLLIGLVPVFLGGAVIALFELGGLLGPLAVIFAGLYAFVGGLAGMALFAAGVSDHRHSAKQLKALDALYQLPAARVVRS